MFQDRKKGNKIKIRAGGEPALLIESNNMAKKEEVKKPNDWELRLLDLINAMNKMSMAAGVAEVSASVPHSNGSVLKLSVKSHPY